MQDHGEQEIDLDTQAQSILLAASHHDLEYLRTLLREGSASGKLTMSSRFDFLSGSCEEDGIVRFRFYICDGETHQIRAIEGDPQALFLHFRLKQIPKGERLTGKHKVQDPDSGFTPLHAAIAACEPDHASPKQSEIKSSNNGGAGSRLCSVVLEDSKKEQQVPDQCIAAAAKVLRLLLQNGAIWNDVDSKNETPGCLALRLGLRELYEIMVDAGVRAEMLLNHLDEYERLTDSDDGGDEQSVQRDASQENGHGNQGLIQPQADETNETSSELNNGDYLQSNLHFQDGRILDGSKNGVMMAWETGIMQRTARLLAPAPDLRILNIGHGMGIIDDFFQETEPASHHIIEAHPAVLERMRKHGWEDNTKVTIHKGRWQDIVPSIIEEGILFDAIYFDTFAEDYKALQNFFSDYIIGLLDDRGRWGFFNGLGADRQICYDVVSHVLASFFLAFLKYCHRGGLATFVHDAV